VKSLTSGPIVSGSGTSGDDAGQHPSGEAGMRSAQQADKFVATQASHQVGVAGRF
jgi:hypothetical protein